MQLQSRVALVAGAKRIGHDVAVAIAGRGANVAIAYRRSRAEADRTVAAIRALGRKAIAVQADVADEASCVAAVNAVARDLDGLDVLVNLASVYDPVAFDALTVAEFDRQLGVDLRGSFVLAKAVVPAMRHAGGGRIVLFSDWLPMSGRPRYKSYLPYYVAKAGVAALTEALALELAADKILVNAVAPGPILAPDSTSDQERAAVERATPLGRWGGGEEIAKVVVSLIESDFMTGQTVRVDGGRHLQ
jgi:NAD(P)-dependent dehydrogenase (short-subunit alcohol dehydrogenase family)